MTDKYLKRVISRNDRIVCRYSNIYSVYHLNFINTEIAQNIYSEEEANDYLFDNSENAYEISKLFIGLIQDSSNYFDKDLFINQNLLIRKEDFIRYSDKNYLKDVSKEWFDDKAIRLDVSVEILSEDYGSEISIDDCIEHIKSYKPLKYKNIFQQKAEILSLRFKSIFGFYLQKYYAEHLINVCEFKYKMSNTKLAF